MQPLVSVNICTYNRAHLLPRCFESVLRQSYENIEIVIVDDCSTDNTEVVVKQWCEKDARIKYVRHNTNKRLAAARNTGWESSHGKYIAFMDDDDEWIDIDKLKNQVKIFENSCDEKLGIICSSVRLFSDKQTYSEKIIQKPKSLSSHILSRNGIIYSPTVMMKRDIMVEVGGFDVSVPRGVDSDFYRMCIVRYGYDVFFMKEVTTCVYEFGVDRMTKADTERELLGHIVNHEIKLKKFENELSVFLDSKAFIEIALANLYLEVFLNTKNIEYKNAFYRFLKRSIWSKFSPYNTLRAIKLYLKFLVEGKC